jgi:hypothetical protein
MPIRTTGMFPSEYDDTTNALLQTVQLFGTTDKDIEDDQLFLVDLMMTIGASPHQTMADTINAMDVAFLGLIYHRHMPYEDENGDMVMPDRAPNDYVRTLNLLANSIVSEVGVPLPMVTMCANDAAEMCMSHMRRPDSLNETTLHEHMLALFVIGLLIHRFIPLSDEPPTTKGN